MPVKAFVIRQFSRYVHNAIQRRSRHAVRDQERIFKHLVYKARNTVFGQDHGFDLIKDYSDFSTSVSLRNYEGIRIYIDQILAGNKDVLWPGRPKYFAKTSGTTSGVKYIPITPDSMGHHIAAARNAILNYIHLTGLNVFEGKMIFLSGSPELDLKGGIRTGRLSGIVNHEIPGWARPNQLPSYATNCIEDWETKLDQIVMETIHKDMTLISGIPPWVQMYYERLIEVSGKKNVRKIFPNFRLFIHGGVNYEPYRQKMSELVGADVDTLETYPASEGFIAFQDRKGDTGLLLNTNAGIFYEFVPSDHIYDTRPERLWLKDVELGTDYALVISSNAGLWSYILGDTIQFVSLNPYKIIVTGRISHFISAFGEHVIGKEVDEAVRKAQEQLDISINEFTVAPQVNPGDGGPPFHEWFIEFEREPESMKALSLFLDECITGQNIYYADLIKGGILRQNVIRPMRKNAFRDYMRSIGKLGGQNKVPRLKNDRSIADVLMKYVVFDDPS